MSIFDHLPNLERVLQVAVALVPPASDLDQILGVEHCQVASWEFGCQLGKKHSLNVYLGLYSYMSVQIYILVHEDIDGKMRTRRCCIADCFASERAKHALYASASQLSNNTYPEICLLSA